jgi:transcriptional regulator with XRE-family HTH domain
VVQAAPEITGIIVENTNNKQDRSSVKGFGSKLRAEREAREISLEEISRVTRISLHLLRSMEEDNWDDLPGGIFTRNFIRLYARHLGLDAEKLVDEYVQFIDIKHKAEIGEKKESSQGFQDTGDGETSYTWMYVTLVATVILLITGFILVNSFSANNSQQPRAEESTNQSPNVQGNSESVSRVSNAESGNAIMAEDEQSGLNIELVETSRASTWFQWRADGELKSPPDGENLSLNQTRSFVAEESMWFNLARIQSIKLHINGQERNWSDFNPQARKNEDGATISYIVEIKLSDLE